MTDRGGAASATVPPGSPEERGEAILRAHPVKPSEGGEIGRSREGAAVRAFRFGSASGLRVSLIAGCHADEPVGPRLLASLCAFLARLPGEDPLVTGFDWWIVPHVNPDGARRNSSWQDPAAEAYDVGRYLRGVVRELPGDDIEFGFPGPEGDPGARPENRAVHDWWRSAPGPFHLHVSLHGMAFAAGPWFLIEPAWLDRTAALRARCRARTGDLGYVLHDVERKGEKGFFRIERGFATRPDSERMRAHFIALGDRETAARFRPSSMEAVRSFGGDPLTLVTEMPLFITPGVGDVLGPPDPAAEAWKRRIATWRARAAGGAGPEELGEEAAEAGLRAMPVGDQMRLQWMLIAAGIRAVRESTETTLRTRREERA